MSQSELELTSTIPEKDGGDRGIEGKRAKDSVADDSTPQATEPRHHLSEDVTNVQQELPSILPSRTKRAPFSRASTRDSLPLSISSSQSAVQLFSSLIAGSSSEDGDEAVAEDDDDDRDDSTDSSDYDLHPPAARLQNIPLENLSELVLSSGHLKTLLHDPGLLNRFTSFVHRHKPDYYPALKHYVDACKAMAAIDYANALMASTSMAVSQQNPLQAVTQVDASFKASYEIAFQQLLNNVLPAFVTYELVKVVSDCLENEITGKINPEMRRFIGGLSEVFCLTDPNQKDNPIVFASAEFYRFTGYGRDEVLGHNCRFLQGQKTVRAGPNRLKASLERAEETSELLLNYRRDGRPFMNLLMLAPLYDNKGKVQYHIGAQIDVSGLVEGGRSLDGFRRYLNSSKSKRRRKEWPTEENTWREHSTSRPNALAKLKDLSEMFDHEESAIVHMSSRSVSSVGTHDRLATPTNEAGNLHRGITPSTSHSPARQVPSPLSGGSWQLGSSGPEGPSGKLPGVYEKYMLIRPAPSLRIIFVSHKMQSWGNIVQHPFMSLVAAERGILAELNACFKSGTPVSAKIRFMHQRGSNRKGTPTEMFSSEDKIKHTKACWISATPLIGSRHEVGVWMIVFVEHLKGSDATRQGVFGRTIGAPEYDEINRRMLRRQSYHRSLSNDLPIRPRRIDGRSTASLNTSDYFGSPKQSTDRPTSRSPSANESRKASPRLQAAFSPRQLSTQIVNRKRLATDGDSDTPAIED